MHCFPFSLINKISYKEKRVQLEWKEKGEKKKSKDMEQKKIQKFTISLVIFHFLYNDSWKRIIFPASIALVPVYYKIQI